MNDVVPFSFENISVRVIVLAGVPWWVASDVCRVLAIENPTRAVARLDEDDRALHTVKGNSGERHATIINESGLYSLSSRPARKPPSGSSGG